MLGQWSRIILIGFFQTDFSNQSAVNRKHYSPVIDALKPLTELNGYIWNGPWGRTVKSFAAHTSLGIWTCRTEYSSGSSIGRNRRPFKRIQKNPQRLKLERWVNGGRDRLTLFKKSVTREQVRWRGAAPRFCMSTRQASHFAQTPRDFPTKILPSPPPPPKHLAPAKFVPIVGIHPEIKSDQVVRKTFFLDAYVAMLTLMH